MTGALQDRLHEERDFHDRRELDRRELAEEGFQRKYSNKKWYTITRLSRRHVDAWITNHGRGARALDYCCGLGGMSLKLAKAGAEVWGVDISLRSIETARDRLIGAGLARSATFSVMNAELLAFPAGTFDLVVCSGVLHHLDLDRAYAELARVLKPHGRALCIEALAHNPLISWYRRRTPHLRTAWEIEHILRVRDIYRARTYFRHLDVRFFHLCSIAAVPLRGTWAFEPVLATLDRMDGLLLRVPGVRSLAWQAIFELSFPVAPDEGTASSVGAD
jgi:ubiquinone/menaquinone biosynthesis C-methylase UbiE